MAASARGAWPACGPTRPGGGRTVCTGRLAAPRGTRASKAAAAGTRPAIQRRCMRRPDDAAEMPAGSGASTRHARGPISTVPAAAVRSLPPSPESSARSRSRSIGAPRTCRWVVASRSAAATERERSQVSRQWMGCGSRPSAVGFTSDPCHTHPARHGTRRVASCLACGRRPGASDPQATHSDPQRPPPTFSDPQQRAAGPRLS